MNDSTVVNYTNYSCYQHELQGKPTKSLFRLIFLPLLILSAFGNTANIVVYRHPYLRGSTTVRMLSFKAVANLLSVLTMVPSFVYFYGYENEENKTPFLESERIPWFYWHSLKYALFAANWFSTIAVWLTAAVTLEHYILVGCPIKGKAWSTMKNVHIVLSCSMVTSALLHCINLVAFKTKTIICGLLDKNLSTLVVYLYLPTSFSKELITSLQAYFWIHSTTVQIVPMVLLVCLSWLIYHKLFRGRKITKSTKNEQRQTVVRLALATTACHVIFEMPHVIVMVLAAVFGTHRDAWPLQPEINAAAMFLGFTNASVTFLVYLSCSKKFRQIAALMCCPASCIPRLLTDEEMRSLSLSRNALRTTTNVMSTFERRQSDALNKQLAVKPNCDVESKSSKSSDEAFVLVARLANCEEDSDVQL